MPYKVLVPEASILNDLQVYTDDDGKVLGIDHESVLRKEGEIIPDDQVSPVVKEAYASGDEHTLSILEKVSDSKQEKKEAPAKPAAPKKDQ